ncbi:hypothetical protein ABE099_06975 [Paenibacillus turicensis]|uniref:hypothetical protein n=1 Tax=Paenibacillus turicensis TaxID=160487 RepID=UPI003D2D9E1C
MPARGERRECYFKSLIIEDAVAGDLAQIVEVYIQTITGRMITALECLLGFVFAHNKPSLKIAT